MGFLSRLYGPHRQDEPAPAGEGEQAGPGGSLDETRFRLQVEAVLNALRPALHADGGDIELVDVIGKTVMVRMTGACDGCASANFTLRLGIEKKLREEIPDFEELIPV